MHPAGRALLGLWAGLALLVGGGAVVLWRLGPPPAARQAVPAIHPQVAAPAAGHGTVSADGQRLPVAGNGPDTRTIPAPPPVTAPVTAPATAPVDIAVSPPVPALQEAVPDAPGRTLPIIAADGRTPAVAYAARAGLPAKGPQVAILLEGLGLSDTLDHRALDTLPPQISFAVSPYADGLDRPGNTPMLDLARHDGHELWLSLPMEPAGSPADTEGTKALTLGIDLSQDHAALLWCLSRFPGFVGLTNALGGLRGDRFASSGAFSMVSDEVKRRGLSYVDAGLAPHAQPAIDPPGARHADLTIDESPDASDIQARLSRLEQLAQANGSALGIAGPLRPVTLDRLRDWSKTLRERGIALVPVSALPAPHPPVRDVADQAAPARAPQQQDAPIPTAAPAALPGSPQTLPPRSP